MESCRGVFCCVQVPTDRQTTSYVLVDVFRIRIAASLSPNALPHFVHTQAQGPGRAEGDCSVYGPRVYCSVEVSEEYKFWRESRFMPLTCFEVCSYFLSYICPYLLLSAPHTLNL